MVIGKWPGFPSRKVRDIGDIILSFLTFVPFEPS
jgi:hypothetical protein